MNGITNEAAMSFRIYTSEKTSLLRIRGHGPRAGRRPNLEGITTKATMSFRMTRMGFGTVRYCGLGRSQRSKRSADLPAPARAWGAGGASRSAGNGPRSFRSAAFLFFNWDEPQTSKTGLRYTCYRWRLSRQA